MDTIKRKDISRDRVNAILAELNELARKKWDVKHKIFNVWNSEPVDGVLIVTCDIRQNDFKKYFDEIERLEDGGNYYNRVECCNKLNKWVIEHVLKTDIILLNHKIAFFYEDKNKVGDYIFKFNTVTLYNHAGVFNQTHSNVLLYTITND